MKTVSILGATGSVGRSTVDLIRSNPSEFQVQAVTAATRAVELADIAKSVGAKMAVVADDSALPALRDALAGTGIMPAAGAQALTEAAEMPADYTMAAIVGLAGLLPVLAAIRQGKQVAIANKEPLVAAGALVMQAARQSGATLLPVDSEHNAIFQVFESSNRSAIERIILTASGGPFRTWGRTEMENATPAQAVAHPNWSMGAKISVDSATMMNKALEVVEAHHLFAMPPDRIDVLVHPQSIIHSMVEYADGSVLAQLGAPDMRTPIAHSLAWPRRMKTSGQRLDILSLARLDFEAPDHARFPALRLAYRAIETGPAACVAVNAANEVAVAAFLAGTIRFGHIVDLVTDALEKCTAPDPKTLEEILAIDKTVRDSTQARLAATS